MSESQQFKIKTALISADRFGEEEVDIRNLIVEVDIYEDIEKAYLSGQIVISDDQGLFDGINFKGTETLSLEIASGGDDLSPFVDKEFMMTRIEKSTRVNERTEVFLVQMVEKHFVLNQLKRLSRGFSAPLEKIMTQIIGSELNKDVDLSYMTPSAQGSRRLVVPFMKPMEAIEWVRDRASTETGSPYFVYATIHDDNIRIATLDGILVQPPFNKEVPYLYSISTTSKSNELPEDQRSFLIENYKAVKQEDTLKLITSGSIGAQYNNIDLTTGLQLSSHYTVRSILEDFKNREIIPSKSTQNVFDDQQQFEDKFVDDFNSREYYQVNSSNSFLREKGYHDVANNAEYSIKLKNHAIRNLLFRNMLNIVVPGVGIIHSKVSVGDTIKVNFLSSNSSNDSLDTETLTDKNKSGNYMIYSTRHTFRDTKHFVSMAITKLTKNYKDA